MSYYIDLKYIQLLSSQLNRFQRKSDVLWNFRCPYCLDSTKSVSKARGYIFKKSDKLIYKCHNCSKGASFQNLLKYVDESLYNEYCLEKYRTFNSTPETSLDSLSHLTNKSTKKFDIPSLKELSDYNVCKQYVINRKIPDKYFDILFYAENFGKFANDISGKDFKFNNNPRLVIPFYSQQKELIAIQGRSLVKSELRYATVRLNDDLKIYGLERWNPNEQGYIVEGPLNSLLIPNALAVAGSEADYTSNFFQRNDFIFIPDIEPRNAQIVNNVDKWVKLGLKVSLLPHSLPGKDINELILNGITQEEIIYLIHKNTYSGLSAKMFLAKWKKV